MWSRRGHLQGRKFSGGYRSGNRSEFGLGTNVFTTELSEAMRAVEEIEAGMVFVNNRLIDNDVLSFRGWKNSGIGRSLNRRGLDALRLSKNGSHRRSSSSARSVVSR